MTNVQMKSWDRTNVYIPVDLHRLELCMNYLK